MRFPTRDLALARPAIHVGAYRSYVSRCDCVSRVFLGTTRNDQLRVIATVQDPAVVRAILAHLGLVPGPDSPGPDLEPWNE